MNPSRFSVHRPVFTSMAALIVVLLGVISLLRLPIDLMPDITYPTLSVSTSYENASPEEVEELITRPIEEALGAVPGVEEITSDSSEGNSSVRVSFSWGTNLDAAAADVRDRMDRVISLLPDEADRPTLRKFDLAAFPILIMGVSSDLDPLDLRKIIDDQVKYRFERIPGVASLMVHGGREREIHVNVDIEKTRSLGLALDRVIARIRSGNVNMPAGSIERGNLDVRIRVPGTYDNLDQLRETVIDVRGGTPIRVGDVAKVEDSYLKENSIVRVNGRPGLRIAINKQSGSNTVEVARRALREIERINEDIPQLHITPIIDTSKYIQNSINNIASSAIYGGLLAVIVLLVFLRNILGTLIIAVCIPVSIIATFAMIYFGGFTLNIMTLGGLALGVGMLVDNAIVVLENITRLRDEDGLDKEKAAVEGSGEVVSAIVASTLTTVAVFLPLVFMRGMSGVMFKQLSLVVSFALLCSLFAAMTLVPMLSSKLLRRSAGADNGVPNGDGAAPRGRGIFGVTEKAFRALEDSYKSLLHFALNQRWLVVLVSVVLLVGSVLLLAPEIGRELMPATDEGEARVSVEMEVGTRLGVMDGVMRRIEGIVLDNVPERESAITFIGATGWRSIGTHTAEMRVGLKSMSERERSSAKVADDLRPKLMNIPGARVRTRAGQGLFILRMGSSGGDAISVEIRGYDLDTANALAAQVEAIAAEVKGVTDTSVSREAGIAEENIIVDRRKAEDMQINVSQAAQLMRTALAGSSAGYFRDGGDEYRILVKVEDAEKMRLEDILDLSITNTVGEPVILRNMAEIQPRMGPVSIERKDQERIITVSANIEGRDMGSVIDDLRQALRGVAVPQGFSIGFGGDFEEQQKAFKELLLSFVLAIILVYMVMACQFESLRDPFVVMFAVPFAAIGVLVMLFLTDTTLNIQSYIGCIMLAGIVVNNAILLVDHTNLLRRRDGMRLREAIEEAGRRRLRPILMTALTTILGLLPLAIGMGEGGEAQAPMARAVIGGLVSSTAITLVLVPVIYSLFERIGRKKAGNPEGAAQ
jgi:HAE1 family hydrophobic/amphiphilic exporter-1